MKLKLKWLSIAIIFVLIVSIIAQYIHNECFSLLGGFLIGFICMTCYLHERG